MTAIAPGIQQQWSAIAPILTIRNEQEYDQSIARLNELLDEVGTSKAHLLYTLLDTLGLVIFQPTKTLTMPRLILHLFLFINQSTFQAS